MWDKMERVEKWRERGVGIIKDLSPNLKMAAATRLYCVLRVSVEAGGAFQALRATALFSPLTRASLTHYGPTAGATSPAAWQQTRSSSFFNKCVALMWCIRGTSQPTCQPHPSGHAANIPAEAPVHVPAEAPATSRQAHQQCPGRRTSHIPADAPATSRHARHQHPGRRTGNIPAGAPPTSRQMHRQHPGRHTTNIPAGTPPTSRQARHQHPGRRTGNIPAGAPPTSRQTHRQHPGRHTTNIPADAPATSRQTHRPHPGRRTGHIPADAPATSRQTHYHHSLRALYVLTAEQLWRGVVADTGAGARKGRGKRTKRKVKKDLNRGQSLGEVELERCIGYALGGISGLLYVSGYYLYLFSLSSGGNEQRSVLQLTDGFDCSKPQNEYSRVNTTHLHICTPDPELRSSKPHRSAEDAKLHKPPPWVYGTQEGECRERESRGGFLWPGLNTPVVKGGTLQSFSKRGEEEQSEVRAELERQRDEWDKKRKMKIKRERGWTGNSWGGISLGPPDPGPNGGWGLRGPVTLLGEGGLQSFNLGRRVRMVRADLRLRWRGTQKRKMKINESDGGVNSW
ncbi:hypothetical protein NFI96_021932, partial [Prochilodus magdalenae]